MIRVAIADDHQLFVEGLRDALHAVPDLRIVHTSVNPTEMLERLESQPADVLLIDLEMPEGGGARILDTVGHVPAIVVSMHATPEAEAASIGRGAKGFLSKSTPLTTLAAAIRAVAAGESLDGPPEARKRVLEEYQTPRLDPGAESLTDRERELLQLLAQGTSSTEELAERLFISQKTVKNHLASIFQKLSVSDRTQAAVEAIRLGFARPK